MTRKKRYQARKPQQYGTEIEIFDHSTGFKMVATFNDFYSGRGWSPMSEHVERLPAYVFRDVYALEGVYERKLKRRAVKTQLLEDHLVADCKDYCTISAMIDAGDRANVSRRVHEIARELYSNWDHYAEPLCYESEDRVIMYIGRRATDRLIADRVLEVAV